MLYAQFHNIDEKGTTRKALGSNGVVILDGRLSLENAAAVARQEGRKRGFFGFHLERGERFTTSRTVRGFEEIEK